MYLLQLVQALRYDDMGRSPYSFQLLDFLIKRSQNNTELAISLFWYLHVANESASQTVYSSIFQRAIDKFVNEIDNVSKSSNTFTVYPI